MDETESIHADNAEFPDGSLSDPEFQEAVASRLVDSRYFAQLAAKPKLNALLEQIFDLLATQEWESAWNLIQTEPVRACRSAPFASPFSAVLRNRINLVFAELYSLTHLVWDHIEHEIRDPKFVLALREALDHANQLDYKSYVEWGSRSAARYENVRDIASMLASRTLIDDRFVFATGVFQDADWDAIKTGASYLKRLMDDVLNMDEVRSEG